IHRKLNQDNDGTSIPDNDVFLSEIFDHINNSTKIEHDAGLLLFEEKGKFVEISSSLRKFFEENVYPRGSIPDSEWVNYLDKFFKFIIDRRIRRVNEWFENNLAKFSKEHNEIVITNYALEREINRLNLFWNVCRLKCDNCGLSCLKASRHDDNPNDASHDCQTDHKCHHECEFKEAHPDGIIPDCVHFAAHQGKHRYIGHENMKGNETHKCDSEMHYCGEPCSLEAITLKGPYKCQNECMA
ncbi:23292_t:CDS:2, partial [Racocetra persica]